MTQKLPSGGTLRLSDVKANMEITSSDDLSLGDERLRALANKKTGEIALSDFYNANELESLILAGEDPGAAIGYYRSFWGENDKAGFEDKTMGAAFDALDGTPRFVVAVDGNQEQNTFRALIINNNIYYAADASLFQYQPGTDATIWEWSGQPAGLEVGVVYELSYLLGPDTTTIPEEPVGTFPVGQGTEYSLEFEDNFDTATLDTSTWNLALWYLQSNVTENPPGVVNYDIDTVNNRLRIWPVQYEGRWIRRDLTTSNTFEMVNGYWEIKCKMPKNKGIRTAFWLMNHDTDARPIITPVQCLPGSNDGSGWTDASNNATDFSFGVQPITDGEWLEFSRYTALGLPAENFSDSFHVWGIKKTDTTVQFFLDGVEYFYTPIIGPNAMTLSHYIILTLDYNVEAAYAADGTTVQGTTDGGAFEIEYVRAWSIIGTDTGGGDDGGSENPSYPSGYVAPVGRPPNLYPYLTFREEFTGTSLDLAKWDKNLPFVSPVDKGNIAVENSTLYMWPALPFDSTNNALICTASSFWQKFGYFEVRAKLPIGRGCWPAFWMYNMDFSTLRPEIDVFEAYSGGNEDGDDWANALLHPIRYQASAWSEANSTLLGSRNSASYFGYVDLSADWHTYGVDWRRGSLQFYFDGTVVGPAITFANDEMDMRLFLVAALWLGSESGQANTDETPIGQTNSLEIDYIRAWALNDGTTVVDTTLPALTEAEGGKPTGSVEPDPDPVVAFYGNSTMYGYKSGVGTRVDIPTPLAFAQRQPAYVVRNEAINSTQTTHWLAGTGGTPDDWAALMVASTANYIVLCFGTLEQFDLTTTQFKTDLKSMVQTARTNGKTVVLLTPFICDFSGIVAFAQAVRDAAAEIQCPYIDLFQWSYNRVHTTGTGNVRDYVPDGVHPSDQMYIDAGEFISNNWAAAIGGVVEPPPPDPSDPTPAVPVDHPHTYELVFEEKFDGSSLNTAVWNDHIWWNEGGEKTGKPVNWQVSNGQLHIWPESPFAPRTIDTDYKLYFTYGFFECESILPNGRGPWPAFWLYNHDDGTLRPEIDIMEAYSGGGLASWWSDADLNPINYGMTLWQQDGAKIQDTTLRSHIPDGVRLDTGYHKYGCLWEPDGVTFFFDGQQMGSKMMTNFFTRRMYILLDLYFGSASGTPDGSTPTGISNAFSTRYVRVWKKV